MSIFMDWLRNELAWSDEKHLTGPLDEVVEGEEVVGIITDHETKQLYGIMSDLSEEITTIVYEDMKESDEDLHQIINGEAFDPNHNPNTCRHCINARKVDMLRDKMETISKIFWTCVQQEMSDEDRIDLQKMGIVNLSIRKNWQIVVSRIQTISLSSILSKSGFA